MLSEKMKLFSCQRFFSFHGIQLLFVTNVFAVPIHHHRIGFVSHAHRQGSTGSFDTAGQVKDWAHDILLAGIRIGWQFVSEVYAKVWSHHMIFSSL
jgi:hypothetical protein